MKRIILTGAVLIGLMLSGNVMSQDIKKVKEDTKTEVKNTKDEKQEPKKENK